MTKSPLKVILLGEETWQLARFHSPHTIELTPPVAFDPHNLRGAAEQIAIQAKTWGSTKRPILLALGSVWCVAMTIPLPPGRKHRQRQALSYVLEPYLPWSAEETTCDFEFRNQSVFSAALETSAIQELLSGLGEDLLVASITPAARHAVSAHVREYKNLAVRYLLLWSSPLGVELWEIDHDLPTLWQKLPHSPESVVQAVRQIQLRVGFPLIIVARDCSVELRQKLGLLSEATIRECPAEEKDDLLQQACREADAILKGKHKAALEFRRGDLSSNVRDQSLSRYRGILRTSILLLLISVAFAFYERGNRYDLERRKLLDRQAEIFRKLFPETPLPVGVQARFESEYTRLAAMRGKSDVIPTKTPAIQLLEKVLRSIPQELRFRLLEVRLESGRLYLVGQVREHAEADRIAEGLRQANLLVDPPTTHRLPERGVEFRISAKVPTENGKAAGRSL